LADVKRLFSST